MNSIKLVACDIDGTLLPVGQTEISPAVFDQIRRLHAIGVRFCPASGRQYTSLRRLFAPVAADICYLCENGSVVYGENAGEILHKTVIDHALAMRLCRAILDMPNAEILISGADTSYVIPKSEEYVRYIRDGVGNNTVIVPSPEAVPEDIIKISVCIPEAGVHFPCMKADWPEFAVALSGKEWIDFTLADKGIGIEALCEAYGILPSEVLAIGDNYNDLPMLSLVGHPYLMDTAVPELLRRFDRKCAKVEDVLAAIVC